MIRDYITNLLSNLGAAILVVAFVRDLIAVRKGRQRWDSRLGYVAGDVLLAVSNALQEEWGWCAAFTAFAICFAVMWWRRRKRRRTLAALGAKGRARIAAMKRAMRERAKPRPVLKPQRSPV